MEKCYVTLYGQYVSLLWDGWPDNVPLVPCCSLGMVFNSVRDANTIVDALQRHYPGAAKVVTVEAAEAESDRLAALR